MTVRQLASRVEQGGLVQQRGSPAAPTRTPDTRTDFADALRRAREQMQGPGADVRMSAHAQQRISQRSIAMTPEDTQRLGAAMQQLEQNGAQDALLLRGDAAFVVNVPSRTVVTAMNQTEMQDRIFTQIDSAMLV